MGMFDEKLDKKEFDRFQNEVRAELTKLSESIASKVTDAEEDTRRSADNARVILAEVENGKLSINNSVNQIEALAVKIISKSDELVNTAEQAIQQKKQIEEFYKESQALKNEVSELKNEMNKSLSESSTKLQEINQNLTQCAGLPEKLTEANDQISQLNEKFKQVEDIVGHSVKKKSQIDELHKTIMGQDIKTEDGKVEHIEGLKEELETAYDGFKERIKNLEGEINQVVEDVNGNFNTLLRDSSAEYDAVSNKLKSLLPDALAAGLSAAYEKKKTEEEISLKNSSRLFNWLILALVVISCLP